MIYIFIKTYCGLATDRWGAEKGGRGRLSRICSKEWASWPGAKTGWGKLVGWVGGRPVGGWVAVNPGGGPGTGLLGP